MTKCGVAGAPYAPDWSRNPKGWQGIRSTGWASVVTCPDCGILPPG